MELTWGADRLEWAGDPILWGSPADPNAVALIGAAVYRRTLSGSAESRAVLEGAAVYNPTLNGVAIDV